MTNKSKASTNLLPIFIIIALIVAAGFLLTKDDIKAPWQKSDKVRAEHLTNFPREVPTLEQLEKERLVLKSQQELDSFLMKVDPTGSTKVSDKIDFNKEWVIVATSPTLTTDGYKLKIQKIYDDTEKQELRAVVIYEKPGETCEVQEVSNIVVDMVKIKQTTVKIDFDKEEKEVECGDKEPEPEESTPSETDGSDASGTRPQGSDTTDMGIAE
jgi:hypothetical protein